MPAYAYVANQPLSATDPLGLRPSAAGCTSGMTGPYSGWVNCSDPDPGSAYLENPGASGAGDFLGGSGEPWQQLDPSCREYATPTGSASGPAAPGAGGVKRRGHGSSGIKTAFSIGSTLSCAAGTAERFSLAGLLGHIPGAGRRNRRFLRARRRRQHL